MKPETGGPEGSTVNGSNHIPGRNGHDRERQEFGRPEQRVKDESSALITSQESIDEQPTNWVVLLMRTAIRSLTYAAYDLACMLGFKDLGRVSKVALETLVDEGIPPRNRSLQSKCVEYLIPVALSSLLSWYLRTRRQSNLTKKVVSMKSIIGSALYAVIYRVLRQAVIYRLFFRFGSVEYILISVIGILISFFREEGVKDLFRIHRWPRHISFRQGTVAVARSIAYTVAFVVPIKWLRVRTVSRRLANNFRKLVYFVGIAIFSQLWARLSLDLNHRKRWVSPLKPLPQIPA